MRRHVVIVLALAVSTPAIAADCTLYNARYKQPDAPWWLTFTQVPQFAAANQTAAFYIELPNSGVRLEGGVSVPNGFGAPLWSISGPCSAEADAETCTFLNETSMPSIYGIYDGKVTFLGIERGSVAPDQVILPELAASLWYSSYRQDEWDADDLSPGDAFELVGCE
ncbi:hypothetical protein SAMN06295905_2114 [Devosia lucknowensis]|uniref:Uncharacterized protein n=1 Tax=Devosia lucknowensis TaxID=1096929 RepID=A0A1Y6FCP1_9HYPH|nr:hypothetical protein [Devosia lucknowensis]SMQ72537.1 hypothetical protein SAMN06295905_2114 [Devosia lucknowensis]